MKTYLIVSTIIALFMFVVSGGDGKNNQKKQSPLSRLMSLPFFFISWPVVSYFMVKHWIEKKKRSKQVGQAMKVVKSFDKETAA